MNIIDSALVPPPTACSGQLVISPAHPGVLERVDSKRLKLLQGRAQSWTKGELWSCRVTGGHSMVSKMHHLT